MTATSARAVRMFTLNLVARDGIMFLSCMSDNRSVGLSG